MLIWSGGGLRRLKGCVEATSETEVALTGMYEYRAGAWMVYHGASWCIIV